ncbi:MAG: pyridoxamine 5'-phosphate oxidase family protein, partial [Saprospiraceae bacterium]
IFLIPGVKETLRVNGTAQIVTDKEVLELLSCDGKLPLFAIIVTVKEAFMHCSKCMIRSKLWRGVEDTQDRIVPTLGKVLVDHAKLDIDYKKLDEEIEDDEKNNLY